MSTKDQSKHPSDTQNPSDQQATDDTAGAPVDLNHRLNLQISLADAIVLAEFIRELERKLDSVELTESLLTKAERRALARFDKSLEKELTEPRVGNYRETFERAVDTLSGDIVQPSAATH